MTKVFFVGTVTQIFVNKAEITVSGKVWEFQIYWPIGELKKGDRVRVIPSGIWPCRKYKVEIPERLDTTSRTTLSG
jgi:hypothetical protein